MASLEDTEVRWAEADCAKQVLAAVR